MSPAAAHADTPSTAPDPDASRLDFLWLELTNRCNLRCVHCYTESSPDTGDRDLLTTSDYVSTMHDAAALGCRSVQFIGGEPQLHRDFPALLTEATRIGFDFVEVFSNLTFLAEDTVSYAAAHGIRFATSVYSDEAPGHDAVTGVRGSHAKTVRNLRRLIAAGVDTRAATIRVEQDDAEIGRTTLFLRELGVPIVRTSEVREFGRGEEIVGHGARMTGLCGHCWNGKLCVAPDGAVFPCVMARHWPVGNILEVGLEEIVRGMPLRHVRREIYETVWLPRIDPVACGPHHCPQSCEPDYTVCTPDITTCPQSCSPPIIIGCPPEPTVQPA